jgi:hypothetical protein
MPRGTADDEGCPVNREDGRSRFVTGAQGDQGIRILGRNPGPDRPRTPAQAGFVTRVKVSG